MRRRRGTGERRLIKTSCQFAAGPEPEFAVDVTEVEFNGLRGVNRAVAVSLLVAPAATLSATCSSCGVSDPVGPIPGALGVPPEARSSILACSAHCTAPSASNSSAACINATRASARRRE